MKKKLLYPFIISLICFIGCRNHISFEKMNDYTVLPNNYILSISEEKKLKDFAISRGYIYSDGRAVKSNYTDLEIEEMIHSLKEEFGESAEKYYGELDWSDIENDYSSRKAGSVFKGCSPYDGVIELAEPYSSQYNAKITVTGYKVSWGLWWCKYKKISTQIFGNIKYTFADFELDCPSISYTYKDDVTTKSGMVKNTSGFYIEKGNTKYGWLPEMSVVITAWVEHPWVKNGKVFCKTGISAY